MLHSKHAKALIFRIKIRARNGGNRRSSTFPGSVARMQRAAASNLLCVPRRKRAGECELLVIALRHRLGSGIAMGLFATGVATSVLLIAAHDRPFTGQISIGPEPLPAVCIRPDSANSIWTCNQISSFSDARRGQLGHHDSLSQVVPLRGRRNRPSGQYPSCRDVRSG
jgi:hypothetical protein